MAGDFSLDYSADFYIQSPPPPPAPEPNGLFPPFGPTTVTATDSVVIEGVIVELIPGVP